MKNKKIRRISIVMSLLLLFNNLGMFASDSVSQDEVLDSSLTEQTENVVRNSSNIQARMGKYYSDYDDAAFYDTTAELQDRANCYGYAFRMFYAMDSFPSNQSNYKQQPGEFAIKTTPIQLQLSSNESYSVSNYQDIRDLVNTFFLPATYQNYSVFYKFNAILTLIQADAATLGYTLTEYTGTDIPDATTNSSSRLIALVVGPGDYHFYIQHSDNKWSHKRGPNAPKNVCINHELELNNDNIRNHACEGPLYEGGIVKFYYITKNAIVDYKHANGHNNNSLRTSPITTDLAGNTKYSAKDIGSLPEDYLLGCLDYPGDTDYYEIYGSSTGNYTIKVQSYNDCLLQLRIHDDSGRLIAAATHASTSTITVYLEVDTRYYIAVTSPDFTSYEYGFEYTIE